MSKAGLIKSPMVATAMKKVDRANYVVDSGIRNAYQDSPQSLGFGATISAPHMHAHAAEYLLPFLKPGSKVLDVGSGSGYTVALFHHIIHGDEARNGGLVVGVDHIPELTEQSRKNLMLDGLQGAIDSGCIQIVTGDGRLGYAEAGPFDVIHVGAAAPTIPPALVEQLSRPGRMFIPIGTSTQYVLVVDKDERGNVSKQELFGVSYVPLTDPDQQHRY